jgi:protein required for attachment to host cells
MGDLRKDFDAHTKARVKAEVTKDLTKLSATELQDYLTREVWS